MKYILSLFFLFLFITTCFSQSQIDSTGQLQPLGNYPLTSAKYIKGAQRTVTTIADRDNIPVYLRDTGMLVYVTSLDSTYILRSGTANGNWKAFKTGTNGNSKTVLDTVQTTGKALTIAAFSGGGRVVNVSTIGRNGSWFSPTYVTAGDSTYIDYTYAPSGQVVYKLTVLDAADTVSGGGSEITSGGGDIAGRIDSVIITHKDTVVMSRDTIIYSKDTVIYYVDSTGGATGPVDYNTLVNRPSLATVATSGLYADLLSKPAFATIATTGSYTDLSNKPTLFSGDYSALTNKPVLKTVATSGLYTDLTGRPTLSTVATTGSYTDLLNKPTLFSGDYNALTNKPAFATVATTGSYLDLLNRPTFSTVATSGLYADLLSKPTFSTVATTGSYTDLSNKPTIPAQVNIVASNGVLITGTYPNLTAKLDTTYLNNYLASHSIITSVNSLCYANFTRFGLISEPFAGEPLSQYQLTQRTADSLGLTLIRQGLQSGSTANYNSVKALLNSNRQTQINIKNTPEDGSRNFTSNTERPAYVSFLDTLFRNTLAPANGDTLIVCANEDGNPGYHTLDTSINLANQSAYRYYQNELKVMDSIADLYGTHFKVATGGATGPVGWWFVWKNLTDSGRTADANELAQAVFAPGTNLNNYPTSASYGLSIKYTQQLLPYIRTSSIAYWNWHVKVITNGTDSAHINPDIIAFGVQAWKNLTGKNIICNEAATTSVNPNNTAELAAQLSKYMDYVLFYDGGSRTSNPTFAGSDVTYRNTDNSINAIGVNLRNVIQAIKK